MLFSLMNYGGIRHYKTESGILSLEKKQLEKNLLVRCAQPFKSSIPDKRGWNWEWHESIEVYTLIFTWECPNYDYDYDHPTLMFNVVSSPVSDAWSSRQTCSSCFLFIDSQRKDSIRKGLITWSAYTSCWCCWSTHTLCHKWEEGTFGWNTRIYSCCRQSDEGLDEPAMKYIFDF